MVPATTDGDQGLDATSNTGLSDNVQGASPMRTWACCGLPLVMVLVLSTLCSGETTEPDLTAVESHMKALFEQTLSAMPADIPTEGVEVTILDLSWMYEYSRERGLRPLVLRQPDPDGIVRFSSGRTMPWPPGSSFSPWADTAASEQSTLVRYTPYRRISSIGGHRKVEGYISLPSSADLSGVNGFEGGKEGAFNYFGLKRSGLIDTEIGLCTQQCDGKNWFLYHSIQAAGQAGIWERDWPVNGIPPGTQVFLSLRVPADDQLEEYASYPNGGSYTEVYGAIGLRNEGAPLDQVARRVTSMVLLGSGWSKNNTWSSVMIATPSQMHLWRAADTSEHVSQPPSQVSAVETNPYYNETVNIVVP